MTITYNKGFTLVEMLAALLILAMLALLSHRGLTSVLDARNHVQRETDKWQRVATFLERFERDLMLAYPRPVRSGTGSVAPFRGQPALSPGPQIEFSRLASANDIDVARRLAYRLNEQGQIELWIWPTLDNVPDQSPARYPVLGEVARFDVQYLDPALNWQDTWSGSDAASAVPRAIRVRLVLASGEDITRVFALRS